MAPGYVYIGYMGRLSKIGYTDSPKRRFAEHRAIWGAEIGFNYVFEFRTKLNAQTIESRVNYRLRKQRKAKMELYVMTNSQALEIVKDCIGPRMHWRLLEPSDFIKEPHATEDPLMRDGDIHANDKEGPA